MQTQLEKEGLIKRKEENNINQSKEYGVEGNKVNGNSVNDGYDIYGKDARKGGKYEGSLVNHLNNGFDVSSGGDNEDQKARNRQQGYQIPGINSYSEKKIYSDANNILIDTSANIGQVIIY